MLLFLHSLSQFSAGVRSSCTHFVATDSVSLNSQDGLCLAYILIDSMLLFTAIRPA